MAGRPDGIIQSLNQKKPGAAIPLAQELSDSEPPPAEEQVETAVSVEDFLKTVFSFTSDPELEYFFRGHELSSFSLVPSIMRAWEKGAPKFLPNEDRMAKELLIAHYDEFQTDQFRFDQLVRMQHFGLPTRLLDLTGNPLIALYFACEKAPLQQGQVVMFGIKKDLIKYFDSDTVSCLSNLSKLTRSEKDAIDLSLDKDKFNETLSIKQLLHHIRSEKGYFEARVDPSHIGSIVCVKGKRNNIRIKSQHGAFLLFGHGARMPPEGIDGISVRRINIASKTDILGQLQGININASTVYPSMDKSTEQIKAMYVLPES
jgi:FRG domain